MRKLILFSFLSLAASVKAQVHPQLGARSYGMGNTSLCADDVWSVYNNPGAFGFMDKTSLGASAENRFLVKQLSSQALAFGFHPAKGGNMGIHFQQYGFELYRELNGGFSYGMKLFDNFSAGVSINYHGVFLAENYGSKNTVSAALGLLYAPTKNLKIGMRAVNVSRTRLAEFNDERLPTIFGLGMQYQISKKAVCALEAEKDLTHPINIKGGLEINAHEILDVRLGVNSFPFVTSFGFGLNLKNFHFDAAAQWHSYLGLSPSFGLLYTF
ncbi:MAG: hypothetical protein JNJ99_10185 [Crocinitomicaceae bacterium]|nr:hypothetical protein [Crocinitomicaceae bacterium]